jgi:hypothetical protein
MKNEMGGKCGMNGGRGEASIGLWWGQCTGRRRLGRLCVGERIILKWVLNKLDVMVWNVVIWVRLGASGGLL